jgi:hypothetical protein
MMLDHAWTPVNFAATNALCLPRLPALVARLLPGGRLCGRDWVALNPTRVDNRPGSFRINVDTGLWADFATDDKGGDTISLYAYLHGTTQAQAARALNAMFGVV